MGTQAPSGVARSLSSPYITLLRGPRLHLQRPLMHPCMLAHRHTCMEAAHSCLLFPLSAQSMAKLESILRTSKGMESRAVHLLPRAQSSEPMGLILSPVGLIARGRKEALKMLPPPKGGDRVRFGVINNHVSDWKGLYGSSSHKPIGAELSRKASFPLVPGLFRLLTSPLWCAELLPGFTNWPTGLLSPGSWHPPWLPPREGHTACGLWGRH